MSQILSVSATTAGYVADSIKTTQRASRTTDIEQAKRELLRKTGRVQESQVSSISTAVMQPALSLHFLTAGQQNNPQATLEEVIEAYEENKGHAEA